MVLCKGRPLPKSVLYKAIQVHAESHCAAGVWSDLMGFLVSKLLASERRGCSGSEGSVQGKAPSLLANSQDDISEPVKHSQKRDFEQRHT